VIGAVLGTAPTIISLLLHRRRIIHTGAWLSTHAKHQTLTVHLSLAIILKK